MFLSKLWYFFITLAAAIALTIALVMPRPAQRVRAQEEHQRLVLACSVVDILLGDNARNRVDVAASFGRDPDVVAALTQASDAPQIDEARAKAARDLAKTVRDKISSAKADNKPDSKPGDAKAAAGGTDDVKPDFVILLDRTGRVVARLGGGNEGDFGDTLAGRAIVDDALAGYLRDDLWADKNGLFLVSASPVVKRDPPVAYEGAVVLGHAVSASLAGRLVKSLDVNIGFYLDGGEPVGGSSDVVLDKTALVGAVPKGDSLGDDCASSPQTELRSGDKTYTAIAARLPGEAHHKGAFYAVFVEKPAAIGFSGTLGAVKKQDLGFGTFPWLLVGALLVLALGVGMFLMLYEHDKPLRRLGADAVRLAKNEAERLAEDEHHGKFGSIARSVNIQIDKLHRDAKAAKKDLDQLLGPAPEGSLGAADLLATALPAARPGLPLASAPPPSAPPPSEFRFGDQGSALPRGGAPAPALDLGPPPSPPRALTPAPGVPVRPATPPAAPPRPAAPPLPAKAATPTPPPAKVAAAARRAVEDDILGALGAVDEPAEPTGVGAEPGSPQEETYFQQVYEQFVELKKKCGESIAGLTFAKFADKLRKNQQELTAKTGVRQVKFTVYVKDGKAALKATPVKEG